MKQNRSSVVPVLVFTAFLSLILMLSACSSGAGICQDYPAESPEARYCASHTEAVMKFVRITQDPDEQFARYQAVKHFMKTLTECKTEACMEQKIYGKEAPEGFSDRYLLEHETAAQGLQLTSREAARLMKSGFEVAMNRLDKKFLQQ